MWGNKDMSPARGFLTPPPKWGSPVLEKNQRWPSYAQSAKADLFHVIHKVPAGDSPYVRAKHVQLIDKDPSKAVSLFWAAINSGDRVDSALKDMAVVMKQLDRSDEAIEAIKSFRNLCPPESQESIDNILIELYKRSGRLDEEIELLELKLKNVEEGIAFGGKKTKIARSQGKKVQITIEKEYSRLLGNLAWSHMQLKNFKLAEEYYRKALSLESDKNKQSNLAICLMHMNKITEARFLLQSIKASDRRQMDESCTKSFERATQMLAELESHGARNTKEQEEETQEVRIGSSTSDGHDRRRHERTHLPPFSASGPSKHFFTQPRRFSCSLNDDKWNTKDSVSPCSRRLLFEQTANNENVQSVVDHNFNKLTSADEMSKRASFVRGQVFSRSWENDANVESECGDMQPLHCKWKNNTSGNDGSDKISLELSNPPTESLADNNISARKFSEDGGKDCRSPSLRDMVTFTNEHLGGSANLKPLDLAASKSKKSWADMVEEDELGLQFHETPGRYSDGDENVDSNIINLSQSIDTTLCLSEGYHTQPGREVRCSFCFDQNDRKENCSYKFLGKELEFGSLNSLPPPIGDIADQTPVKLMRRNRLQVFRDITPESPKP
ncbi:protein POLLENLESS 3 [Capsicum chacoense]|uniref:protein POLLENLESS 3 n=1 Tax=Capsicum annuum TaxID=4072 RepID=UPI0007BF8787|nr:protein POLLENLESS 3 [Capsicum annuum]KAF3657861.1 Protein POLLENLESS 3-LIKE 1 [Capsicum annuum]KAF3660505.1 Protein POLLENLESS 3-LIKE 1 [Capsicum annuum]